MKQFKKRVTDATSFRGFAILVCSIAMMLVSCNDVVDNPSEPKPPVEKKMVISTISEYLAGELVSIDTLEYDSQGRLVRYIKFGRMGDTYGRSSYDIFTYYPDRIEQREYLLKTDGSFGFYSLKAHFLDDNNRIVFMMRSERASGSEELIDTIYTCQYNNVGQLMAVDDNRIHQYEWEDGNMHSATYAATFSDAPANGYWPITMDEINSQLYWMGWYGKLSAHLPERTTFLPNDMGTEINNIYDYQLEDGRIVSYTHESTNIVPSYNLSFTNHTQYFITWKEIPL